MRMTWVTRVFSRPLFQPTKYKVQKCAVNVVEFQLLLILWNGKVLRKKQSNEEDLVGDLLRHVWSAKVVSITITTEIIGGMLGLP